MTKTTNGWKSVKNRKDVGWAPRASHAARAFRAPRTPSSAARVSFASRARRGLTEAGPMSWSLRGRRHPRHVGRQRGRGQRLTQRARSGCVQRSGSGRKRHADRGSGAEGIARSARVPGAADASSAARVSFVSRTASDAAHVPGADAKGVERSSARIVVVGAECVGCRARVPGATEGVVAVACIAGVPDGEHVVVRGALSDRDQHTSSETARGRCWRLIARLRSS